MARRPNTRPTNIYWLVDTRTGVPWYCGKTVDKPTTRLSHHFSEATRAPNRPVLHWLVDLGRGNVRIDTMEVVPAGGDWVAREKHWIADLRLINPNCLNVCDGGSGAPGYVATAETLERMRAVQIGRKHTAEICTIISVATGQRMKCPEQRARISAALKGRVYSPETLVKMSAAQKARFAKKPLVHLPETRAKMSASAKRRCAEKSGSAA